MKSWTLWTPMVLLGLLSLHGPALAADPPRGTRWALVIGVDKYDDPRLNKLTYCGSDAVNLGEALVEYGGFPKDQVYVVHSKAEDDDERPRYRALQKMLRLVLGRPKRNDLLLISFSGHGIYSRDKKTSYLCPTDADPDQPEKTMIPVGALYRMLDEDCHAGQKVVLVDACRNDPEHRSPADAMAKGFSDSLRLSPEGVQVLASCKALEQSREAAELRHGVFMHYIIEGLKGKADEAGELVQGNQNGQIELDELFNYAEAYTAKYVLNHYYEPQTPELWGKRSGAQIVLSRPRSAAPALLAAPFDGETAKTQQAAWARHLRVKVVDDNSIGMKLVLIPPGEFLMGSSAAEIKAWNDWFQQVDLKSANIDIEGPRHRVRITRPFYLGAHHVTVGQFRKFVADDGYKTDAEKDGKGGYGVTDKGHWEQKPEYTWRSTSFAQTDEHPVVNVSWNDAVAFCQWLSRKEGKAYRLPTEAEWEYACRAGTTTRYWCGDDQEKLAEVANVADATAKAKFPDWKFTISASDGYVFTSPVGSFRPNPFGLYDVHGNAFQWCADWYGKEYYAVSPADDPKGPDSGSYRVYRGGSWNSPAWYCRSANRYGPGPGYRDPDLGFRASLVAAE